MFLAALPTVGIRADGRPRRQRHGRKGGIIARGRGSTNSAVCMARAPAMVAQRRQFPQSLPDSRSPMGTTSTPSSIRRSANGPTPCASSAWPLTADSVRSRRWPPIGGSTRCARTPSSSGCCGSPRHNIARQSRPSPTRTATVCWAFEKAPSGWSRGRHPPTPQVGPNEEVVANSARPRCGGRLMALGCRLDSVKQVSQPGASIESRAGTPPAARRARHA